MERLKKLGFVLLATLSLPSLALSQELNAIDDEEPIDLELVRLPVRRPDHPVTTIITVYDLGLVNKYTEVKVEKPKKEKQPKVATAAGGKAVAGAGGAKKQTQAEIDANVEKYLAEARAKAPEHEMYVPSFVRARRIHDEEKMSREQLLAAFDSKHRVGNTEYLPKSAPSMVEKNSIYLYFDVPTGGKPGPMNIRVQYYADDRLDTQGVEFQINGQKYVITPQKLQTKKNGRFVSEWFDMPLTGKNEALVDAMGYANYVRVKFLGKSCNHVKDLTRDQVSELRKAYFLRKNM